ncbi:MAG: zinc ribbon domain-containing protein [Eubacterium sp.]|nr:zinc ribbon domain-containing protein [Eubacterium sp.]
MYIEFIIIYVLLAILIAVSVFNLIMTLKKSSGKAEKGYSNQQQVVTAPPVPETRNVNPAPQNANLTPRNANPAPQNGGVVFCTKCAHQYPANERFCPNCGQPRV